MAGRTSAPLLQMEGWMPSVEDVLDAARDVIRKVPSCFAITVAEAPGEAHARIVQPLSVDADWTALFVTAAVSRKAREIRRHGRLTLAWQHEGDGAYVALTGAAALDTEETAKIAVWERGLDHWFPDGPADPNAALVTVRAEHLEIWSLARGIMPPPRGHRSAVLTRTGGGWALGTT